MKATLFAATATATALAIAVPAAASVLPQEAERLAPVRLPDLVVALAPKTGPQLTWAYGGDLPFISWDKPDPDANGAHFGHRNGLARVRTAGRIATQVGRGGGELAWTVTLLAPPHERQPTRIQIQPGTDEYACFGDKTRGCQFTPAQAFASPAITARRICRTGDAYNFVEGYRLKIKAHPDLLARFERSEGSGTPTTWLELWPGADPAGLCKG